MNVSPSHLIRLNVNENAMPLNAKEAIRGSPSPWNVFTMMPAQAAESVRRLHASTLLRAEFMIFHVVIMVNSHTVKEFETQKILMPDHLISDSGNKRALVLNGKHLSTVQPYKAYP